MDRYQTQNLAIARRQATALERIASALEREPQMVPLGEIEAAGVITWQDAVRVLRDTCMGAVECGPDCPMDGWCQTYNKEGSAPAKWEPVENEEEKE